jgi:hypothetical protein
VLNLKDFIKSLGREIPKEQMENIIAIGDKRQIMKYCRRFPMASKPVAKPKAKVIVPVKVEEEE